MKKLNIISYLSLVLLAFFLMSNNGGRANVANQGATGAPGEGTCANSGCHDDNVFSPTLAIEVLNEDGSAVEEYFGGVTYTVRLTTTTATAPSGYGFQITSLNDQNEYFGNWEVVGSGQVTELANRTYAEQAGTSTSNVFEATWNVDDFAGDMTFYAVSNAVNSNGSPSGDGTALMEVTIPAAVLSTQNLADEVALSISPNPSSEMINVQLNESFESIKVLNILGRTMIETSQQAIDISALANGTYFLKVELDNNRIATKKLLKI